MDQQVPLRLSSDLHLFNWDDSHQNTSLPEPSRPILQDPARPLISPHLSACSYPLLEPCDPQSAQSCSPSSSPGELTLELACYLNRTNTNQTPLSKPTTPMPQKRQRRRPKEAAPSAKNRRASREVGDSKENPEERRRMQTRLAQRAYRSRQQALVEGLKNRISFLETSMEKMSSTMLSFSEQMIRSGVLKSHSTLTANLRDTMKIFLSLASAASLDDGISGPIDSPPSKQPKIRRPSPNIPPYLPLDGTGLYHLNSAVLPYTVNSPGISIIKVSEFIEKLLLAALYQGHLALCNPCIGLDQLRRPFGLIFHMMSRERLASYLKAELHAQISQKPLDGWDEVPFFKLGGAGTHYPRPLTRHGSTGAFVPRYQRWGTVEEPLSLLTADLRKQLEGDWFDLQDLEGYLRDKNVLLVASVDEPTKCSKVQTNINISRFISALISRGVCLGRTPGFRRDDVEEALRLSKIV
ncbi:hypothetical protein LI328DRAFT_161174 [Trichoderma asperelloides]|nr:hypothetical protein LI328DRAFT_161174 [Trichoderma asperelloides]